LTSKHFHGRQTRKPPEHTPNSGIGRVRLVLLLGALPATVSAAPTKPPTSTSWYVAIESWESDANINSWMYSKGYELGQRDLNLAGTQSSVVILHFFKPKVVNGVYGTSGSGRFLSTATIKEAVRKFAHGYWMGTGSDTSSIVRILIGTTNDNSSGAVTYAHGQAWSQLVRDTDAAIANSGYGSQAKARGAIDIEMSYSTYTAAKAWIDGYNSKFVAPYYVYNYGDAGGCPPVGSCDNGWSQDRVSTVTWRHAAGIYPMPQIYNTLGTNAKQWQKIALYGASTYGIYPAFSGALSQSQACAQKGNCSGMNNTSQQAWDQLWNELTNDNDSRTPNSLSWSTDMRWR
jgi:hypothetical protein